MPLIPKKVAAPTKFTPWNPSKAAIARVANPLPMPTACPCCEKDVEIVNNCLIYKRELGDWPYVLRCTNEFCDAYVGLHPLTNIPLGTLAKAPLRRARTEAKNAFNPIWQGRHMTRDRAYQWLATELGIAHKDCHFAWFDMDTCKRALAICKDFQILA